MRLRLFSRQIALGIILSCLYAVLTIFLGSFGYSWIQVRISECLTPLPFLWGLPGVIGITGGVLFANLFSPVGIIDIIFGPILSLLAAILSWKASFRKRILACLYPVLINAVGVSFYVSHFYGVSYLLTVISIGVGESIACILVGYPLLLALEKIRLQQS